MARNTQNMPEEFVRLNKVLASAGVCSRRKADEYIQAGRVTVNGQVADTPGVKVVPGKDRVAVDGEPIGAPETKRQEYLLLHKPVEVVTTAKDPQGRRCVLDLLPRDLRAKRVFPVGRLDFYSEGLLLLTTDGELTHRLTHPSHHLPKVYHVAVRPAPSQKQLDTMRRGMRLAEGETLAPVTVDILREKGNTVWLEMTLIQGVNRQIRRMCRDLGLNIVKLRRVRQGPVALGDLPPGKWRRLSGKEVAALKKAVGLKG